MKYLVFDLDGTLVDSRPGILYSIRTAVKQILPNLECTEIDFRIGPPIHEMLRIGLHTTDKQLLAEIETAFRESYDSIGWKQTIVYPEVIQTLKELSRQGKICFVATHKPALVTSQIMSFFELSQYFIEIISPDSHQPLFRDKTAMLSYLIRKYSFSVSNSAYIGDSAEDQKAAKECGLDFLGINYGYGGFAPSKSKLQCINRFSEIIPVVHTS